MSTAEYKLQIFQEILKVEDEILLQQLYKVVHRFISHIPDSNFENQSKNETPRHLDFEEWNKQFTDNRQLDEFIPEYEMTLGEFRHKIYEAEQGEEISFDELIENIRKW